MLPIHLKTLLSANLRLPILDACVINRHGRCQERSYRSWPTWPNDWLPFQWKKPELKPGFFDTGDLKEGLDPIDLDKLKPIVENLPILEKAPESVRKMYTFRFARRKEISEYQKSMLEKPYKKRALDKDEYERKIVRLTIGIRHMRHILRNEQPNNTGVKIKCNRYGFKRNKFLNKLYKLDRETCERLCKELEIEFVPPLPYYVPYPFMERKREIRKTCDEYCKNIRETKLKEFHEKLKEEQVKFEEEKKKSMKWIEEQMAKYNITEEMLQDPVPKLFPQNAYKLLE